MICNNCNEDNSLGSANCQRCGAKLETINCRKCKGPVRDKSKFCIHCGAVLVEDGKSAGATRRKSHSQPDVRPSRTPDTPVFRQTPGESSNNIYSKGRPSVNIPEHLSEQDKVTLKDRTIMLKEQFGAVIKKGNYKEVFQDKNHPATQAFIDFIAWGITHFYGFAALIGAITFLGIFLGGWGVVFGLALAFVYATYKKEIDQRIKEMQSQKPSQPKESEPRYRYVTSSSNKDIYFQISTNCSGCGRCVPICQSQAIFQISDKFLIDQTRCNQCGDCEYQCPVRAVIRHRD